MFHFFVVPAAETAFSHNLQISNLEVCPGEATPDRRNRKEKRNAQHPTCRHGDKCHFNFVHLVNISTAVAEKGLVAYC